MLETASGQIRPSASRERRPSASPAVARAPLRDIGSAAVVVAAACLVVSLVVSLVVGDSTAQISGSMGLAPASIVIAAPAEAGATAADGAQVTVRTRPTRPVRPQPATGGELFAVPVGFDTTSAAMAVPAGPGVRGAVGAASRRDLADPAIPVAADVSPPSPAALDPTPAPVAPEVTLASASMAATREARPPHQRRDKRAPAVKAAEATSAPVPLSRAGERGAPTDLRVDGAKGKARPAPAAKRGR